jgi:RES domain-containing protein
MRVFRVAPRERASSPLDGEGSFRYGGRWSNAGTRIAYASTIPELARLEHSLHLPYGRAAIRPGLTVPTALIPHGLTRERNVLINPNHPAFARISVRTVAFTHVGRSSAT